MANITTNGTGGGPWSATSTWSGGVLPQDNGTDTPVIQAGDAVLMDFDQSGWTQGCNGLTITGSSGTPGKLYFANGTNGYLKIKTNTSISGTNATNRGQLVATSDGSIATDTPVQQSNTATISLLGAATINAQYLDIKLRASHPATPYLTLYHRDTKDSGQWFEFDSTTDVIMSVTSYSARAASTSYALGNIVRPTTPGSWVYKCTTAGTTGSGGDPTWSTTEAGTTNDGSVVWTTYRPNSIVLDFDPPSAGTGVMVRAISGSLPGGLTEGIYYGTGNRNTTNNTIQLFSGNSSVVLTQATGSCEMDCDFSAADVNGASSATFDHINTIDSSYWAIGSRVIIANENSNTTTSDQQRGLISSFPSSSKIEVAFYYSSAGLLDSAQKVHPTLYLISRNVSVQSNATSAVNVINFGGATANTAVFDCEIVSLAAFGNSTPTQIYGNAIYNFQGSAVIGGIVAAFGNAILGCNGAFTASGTFIGNGVGGYYTLNSCNGPFIASGRFICCYIAITNCSGNFTASGVFKGCSYCITASQGLFTASGTFVSNYRAMSSCNGLFLASGTFLDNYTIIESSHGSFEFSGFCYGSTLPITTCSGRFIVSGTMTGNGNSGAMFQCSDSFIVTGVLNNNGVGIRDCGNFILQGCSMSGNGTDIQGARAFVAYNSTFNMPTSMSSEPSGLRGMCRSFQHGGVPNDTRGKTYTYGTMTPEAVEVPSGHSYSHKFTFYSNIRPTMFEWEITRPTNEVINITVYAKHDTTGLLESERLHWALVDLGNDPLVKAGTSYLAEFVAEDSTNWQTTILSHMRIDDRPIVLRVWASRSSGNAYALSDVMTHYHRFPVPSFPPS